MRHNFFKPASEGPFDMPAVGRVFKSGNAPEDFQKTIIDHFCRFFRLIGVAHADAHRIIVKQIVQFLLTFRQFFFTPI